jgi:hypothetical protein
MSLVTEKTTWGSKAQIYAVPVCGCVIAIALAVTAVVLGIFISIPIAATIGVAAVGVVLITAQHAFQAKEGRDMRTLLNGEVEKFREANAAHAAEVGRLGEEHAAAVERLRGEHAAEVGRLEGKYTTQLRVVRGELEGRIAEFKETLLTHLDEEVNKLRGIVDPLSQRESGINATIDSLLAEIPRVKETLSQITSALQPVGRVPPPNVKSWND